MKMKMEYSVRLERLVVKMVAEQTTAAEAIWWNPARRPPPSMVIEYDVPKRD